MTGLFTQNIDVCGKANLASDVEGYFERDEINRMRDDDRRIIRTRRERPIVSILPNQLIVIVAP